MCHWLWHFFTSIQTDEYGFCLGQCCSPEREWVGELCTSLPMEELSWLEFLECLSHHLGVRTFSHTLPCMASGAKISKAEAANWGPYAIYLELVCQIHSVASRVLDLAICQRHPCCWYKSSKSFSRRKRASSWVLGWISTRALGSGSAMGLGPKKGFSISQMVNPLFWWLFEPFFFAVFGNWPFNFEALVQPIYDSNPSCTFILEGCHNHNPWKFCYLGALHLAIWSCSRAVRWESKGGFCTIIVDPHKIYKSTIKKNDFWQSSQKVEGYITITYYNSV